MEEFKTGQGVKYEGKETHIEIINPNGTFVIANPDWDWDVEGEFTEMGISYDVPYWITVDKSELSL